MSNKTQIKTKCSTPIHHESHAAIIILEHGKRLHLNSGNKLTQGLHEQENKIEVTKRIRKDKYLVARMHWTIHSSKLYTSKSQLPKQKVIHLSFVKGK